MAYRVFANDLDGRAGWVRGARPGEAIAVQLLDATTVTAELTEPAPDRHLTIALLRGGEIVDSASVLDGDRTAVFLVYEPGPHTVRVSERDGVVFEEPVTVELARDHRVEIPLP